MAEKAVFVQDGNVLNFTNGSTAAEMGDVMYIGDLAAVVIAPVAAYALGAAKCDGVWDVEKASGAVSLGDLLYWDASNKKATTTQSTNKVLGIAVAAAASGDAVARVKINCGTAPAAEASE